MKKFATVMLLSALVLAPMAARADEIPADMAQKMNQIIEGQTRILNELADIKKELEIVKVRATLAGA